MSSIIEQILRLPLFNGVSYNKMTEIIEKYKLRFVKFAPGQTIVEADASCDRLRLLISGSCHALATYADGKLRVGQDLIAPTVLATEYMFGRSTRCPWEIVSIEHSGLIEIEKADYISILHSDPVFSFNFFNYLSMKAQAGALGVIALAEGGLDRRIAFTILALTQPDAERIEISFPKGHAERLFATTVEELTATLRDMEAADCLLSSSGKILVIDRKRLARLI